MSRYPFAWPSRHGPGQGRYHRRMPARKRTASGPAFTVEFPQALEARKDGDAWWSEVDGRELRLSNLDKIFWPDEGYTKGDLIAYYFNVAHLMLPHLVGRPLTMKRMPDGIDGPFFYEKSAPSHVPDWIGRCKVLSDDAKTGVIDYMTIEDAAGLLYIANLGCIEFHPLHSRCEDVEHPGLPVLRPRPVPAVHVRGRAHRGEAHQGAARPARPAIVPEDVRRDRPADLRPGRARPLHVRPGARVRRALRTADPAGRPRPRDHGVEDRRSHRQDLHRPQHEPIGREHRGRLLDATRAAGARLDAAHVGRGRDGRVRAAGLPDRQRLGAFRPRRRPVRRDAHRGGGSDERVRRAGDRPDRAGCAGAGPAPRRRSSRRRRTRTSPSTSASATSRERPSRRLAPPRARATRS